jgi:short-subunit dehydrogenase
MSTAERFAAAGYRVVLTSRDIARLDSRASALRDKGCAVETRKLDASDMADIELLIRQTEKEFETIDVLHYNSAAMQDGTLEALDASTLVSNVVTNIGGTLVATKIAAEGMCARGEGTLLVTGGGFAASPSPEYLTIGIGKAGQKNMVHALFETFKTRGVHIAIVEVAAMVGPGSIEAAAVAEAFWTLHSQPRDSWTPMTRYEAR